MIYNNHKKYGKLASKTRILQLYATTSRSITRAQAQGPEACRLAAMEMNHNSWCDSQGVWFGLYGLIFSLSILIYFSF
jgi:hypothetical protein